MGTTERLWAMSNHADLPERQVTFATKRDFAEALGNAD
jgi:hypothetical protein